MLCHRFVFEQIYYLGEKAQIEKLYENMVNLSIIFMRSEFRPYH